MNAKDIRYNLRKDNCRLVLNDKINDYIKNEYKQCKNMNVQELEATLISAANWDNRHMLDSCLELGINILPGDICYLDFGKSYLKEAGYQHFGLIISVCVRKAFVIPMTSNEKTYAKAYDQIKNPRGYKHLYPLGDIDGLNKKSVLFLNDGRYINTARIIDIKAHLPTGGRMYMEIIRRLKECLQI